MGRRRHRAGPAVPGRWARLRCELNNPLYDDPQLAAAYARVTTGNVCNAAYERPALRARLGAVAGFDVLDAGCAAGDHAAWLVAHGARVVALDASAAMVALARARLGATAQVEQADLSRPLPFDDGAFDLVACSLTLHYLADWVPTLREFARVLRRPGRLVLSTHHPFLTVDLVEDYDTVTLVEEGWTGFGDAPVPVRFYHRSLARILGELAGGGFTLGEFEEVRPTLEADALDPELAARLRARPAFLVLDARPTLEPTSPDRA